MSKITIETVIDQFCLDGSDNDGNWYVARTTNHHSHLVTEYLHKDGVWRGSTHNEDDEYTGYFDTEEEAYAILESSRQRDTAKIKLVPEVYRYEGTPITLESRGDGMWAICDRGCCWNKDGQWECEPLPSNRDDAYLKRNRYTFDEACAELKAAAFAVG